MLISRAPGGAHLSAGGVDADGVVELLLGDATLDGDAVALGHLPGVGPQVVEPDHPVLGTQFTVSRDQQKPSGQTDAIQTLK